VSPTLIVAVVGATVTLATGTGATVTEVCACTPLAVAVSCVWPVATPVTAPFALTVATAGEPVLHETVPVPIGLLNWSRPVTDALAVCPTKIVVCGNERVSVVRTGVGAVEPSPLPPQES